MPLSKIQSEVMCALAVRRNPENYVAVGTPLNPGTGRYSTDIDFFHDREDRVSDTATGDARLLEDAGYTVEWIRRQPLIHTASVTNGHETTKLEWVVDSDYRFFPAVPDDIFGYVLHPIDLATSKVMAAVGRSELRDLLDLITINGTILPLGAVIWAAVDKAPGFTPEGLINEIRRNSNYPMPEWRALPVAEPLDPIATTARLRQILSEAEAFVAKMPTEVAGLLFLKDGRIVQPDPENLSDYETHAGCRRGHWPVNFEVTTAMLQRYPPLSL